MPPRVHFAAAAVALIAALAAHAQDIEPRQFSNTPVGVNFLLAGYAYTRGGLSFDPSLPIADAHLHTSNALFAYARGLDLWGLSGKFDAVVPYTWLSGSAQFVGQPIDRVVSGFGDPAFRLSVNFYGAPALTLKEFRDYRQDLIIGGSLQIFVPLGQYDSSKVVNIGAHRWAFKPEFGASKAIDPWTFELMGAATFFTSNDDFYGGHERTQDPVYSVQGHAIYNFPSGMWAAVDATYYWGGKSYVDGEQSGDELKNWRYGATLVFPVDVQNSVKLYATNGISARTGTNYALVGALWQYRWGGGL